MDLKQMRISLFGPQDLQQLINKGYTFYSNLSNLEVFEYEQMNRPMQHQSVDGISFQFVPNTPAQSHMGMEVEAQQQPEVEEEKRDVRMESAEGAASMGINHEIPHGSSPTHAFQDSFVTVVPIKVSSSDEKSMPSYSFICIPKQAKGKFVPKVALELGCDPKVHFRLLAEGIPVTLANGDIVHPY